MTDDLVNSLIISDIMRHPRRLMRSIHLERDFRDPTVLNGYHATSFLTGIFTRIIDGLRPSSGQRAWRITGDYGVGKSSFALALAHLLDNDIPQEILPLATALGLMEEVQAWPKVIPLLVTAAREPLSSTIARRIRHALHADQKAIPQRDSLTDLASNVERTGDVGELMMLVERFVALHANRGHGLLLVLDELGKYLEYASWNSGKEDVYLLQRLAEMAAGSSNVPFVVLSMLHQGFHAYAERLPAADKHEWDKVAGRFEEIVFDQPLVHLRTMAASILDIDIHRLPPHVIAAAERMSPMVPKTKGEYSPPAALYPLHPTLLPVLAKFFSRHGQHERSLFAFLLSEEPFGLQVFARRPLEEGAWYRLCDFYDYIRATFGHHLSGNERSHGWYRIVEIIGSMGEETPLATCLLKTVAVLNLLDAEDLPVTSESLLAACQPIDKEEVSSTLERLLANRLLFRGGLTGTYRLWPSTTSVHPILVFREAEKALGPPTSGLETLLPFLNTSPVMARRHYLESGTLRHFEVKYVVAPMLEKEMSPVNNADGVLVVALSNSPKEWISAEKWSKEKAITKDRLVIVLPPPLQGVIVELHEARCWTWVLDHSPELSADPYAMAEVRRQLEVAHEALMSRVEMQIGLRGSASSETSWFWRGKRIEPPGKGGVSGLLSRICTELFHKAPIIHNELLNRTVLSTAATAARMRLIAGLFTHPGLPMLGINAQKSPPEKSMYLSVLWAGQLHCEDKGAHFLSEPSDFDPLRLKPSFDKLRSHLEATGEAPVSASELMMVLRDPPYGLRAGVIPLLIAIFLATRTHEVAVYEHGTFLARVGEAEFQRLIKRPEVFTLQLCRVTGIRALVFQRLASLYAPTTETGKARELLDVVLPLCRFATALPEYTRRCTSLSTQARQVREALITVKEPAQMLFGELPRSCGIEPFGDGETTVEHKTEMFIERLQAATEELRWAYDRLLERMKGLVSETLAMNGLERVRLAQRSAAVLRVVREPTMKAFTLRLADGGLSDEKWLESLGSLVVAKPPTKWTAIDEAKWEEELVRLGDIFLRLEATVFARGEATSSAAMRLGMTRADGYEVARVVDTTPEMDHEATVWISRMRESLPADREVRLVALSRLLWQEMHKDGNDCVG